MAQAPIQAAGGIVVRGDGEPLVAVVRLRKDKSWVLPKGKLKPREDALAAAKREVLEETGHDVSVHEFLGSMSHKDDTKLKIVQFWRMRAVGGPIRELMRDVKAVRWLPLDQAIKKLTHPHEQVFLATVGPVALMAAEREARSDASSARDAITEAGVQSAPARKTLVEKILAWFRHLKPSGA